MEPSSTVPMDIKIIILKTVENTSMCPQVSWNNGLKQSPLDGTSAEENN